MITYDDFKKMELVVAKVIAAERVPDSEKLIKLQITVGSPSAHSTNAQGGEPGRTTGSGQLSDQRQIIAGVGKQYEPEQLVGRQIVIVANLEPRTLMGLESQGMLLAAHDENGGAVLLAPDREVPVGSQVS